MSTLAELVLEWGRRPKWCQDWDDKRHTTLYSLHTFLHPLNTMPELLNSTTYVKYPVPFLCPTSATGKGLYSSLDLFVQLVTLSQPHPNKLPLPVTVPVLPDL